MASFKFLLLALAVVLNLGSVMGQFAWDVPPCVGQCWSKSFNMTVKDAMQTCHRNVWDARCLHLYCQELTNCPDTKACLNVQCDANAELDWRIDHMASFFGCTYAKQFSTESESPDATSIPTSRIQASSPIPADEPDTHFRTHVRRDSSHNATETAIETASEPMSSSVVIANSTNSTPCSSIVTATIVRTATFSPNSTAVLPTSFTSTSCNCNTTTVFSTYTYTPPADHADHASSTTTVFDSNSTITMTSVKTSVISTTRPHANITYSHHTNISTATSTHSAPALFTENAAVPVNPEVKVLAWWVGVMGIFVARFL
ncbi:hypothetical protein PV10_02321 [Exophiala mesophila]|uniref:Extracellular membrane protein CFEM domain-containing protein n=1 Tax=Exophiala mesophila TaxID=212818 RepID=A0A0D1Y215_EXOME|nr:uncharacterized protein PV10_02321 [Exophiala mesophila]KIV94566.1 hypothetical protein PV10_02321 [Exophiala mesophila]